MIDDPEKPTAVPQKTIPQMFREIGGSGSPSRLYPSDVDLIVYEASTHHEQCTECGSPTVEVNIPAVSGVRLCVQCVLNDAADAADSETVAGLEYDVEDLQRQVNSLDDDLCQSTEECADLRRQLEQAKSDDLNKLREELRDTKSSKRNIEAALEGANNKLNAQGELIASMTKECDELRERVDAFDDDSTAFKNQNARLLLDIKQLRNRNGTK